MQPRLSTLALAGLVLAVGCVAPRPEGAYTPPPEDKPFDPGELGFGDAAPPDPVDPPTEPDAGSTPVDPPEPVDPDNPLAPVLGRYLMRIDVYSSAPASSGGISLTLSGRVSNLMVTTLTLSDDGSIKSHEILCAQSYLNQCSGACSDWKTEPNPALQNKWIGVPAVDRTISLDQGGKLSAGVATMALGFDDSEHKPALPVDETDARVWKLNGSAYGVSTLLTAKIKTTPLTTTPLNCAVSTVQRFTASFAGKLDLAANGSDALSHKPMLVDASAVTGATIFAKGTPQQSCSKQALADSATESPDSLAVVRFLRYGGAGCPVVVGLSSELAYEKSFPGVATRPSARDLM